MSGNKTKVARGGKAADFEGHNEDVKQLWKEFEVGKPSRIPVQWSMSYKMLVLNPSLNVRGYRFRDCFENPDTMLKAELEFEHWRRHNVWCDWEMGLPKAWDIGVHFQNVYESCWLGAPVHFSEGQVPDAKPFLKTREEMKNFVDNGIPDPFGGLMAKTKSFYEHFIEKKKGFTFKDAPLGEIWTPSGTDGPFTIAVNITAGEILKLLYRDPSFAEKFLWFIADALMERMKAWHKFMGITFPYKGFGFADDGAAHLSRCACYAELKHSAVLLGISCC
jgi:uroporphyrinogen-III decarboxylase